MTFPAFWPVSAPVATSKSYPVKSLTVDMSKPGIQTQAASCDVLGKAGAKKTVTPEGKSTLRENLKMAAGIALFLLGLAVTFIFAGPVAAAIYLGVVISAVIERENKKGSAITAAQ